MGKSPSPPKEPWGLGIDTAFLACESALKRYLARYLHRREDIDDMAQETYLRAYKATDKRLIEFPKAYLFKVARTVALAELSKKMQQLTDYLEDMPIEGVEGDGPVDEELIAEQRVTLYCDAIAELPPQCRRVFLMRKVQGLTHKEIAAALDISVSAVERNMTRGLFQFKRYVDGSDQQGRQEVQRVAPHPGQGPAGERL